MSRQVRRAKKFVRGRRFLYAAIITIVAIGLGVTAGRGGFTAAAATTTNGGDAGCGYSGTTQFTESTVVRWAQVNGQGSGAQFIAYANDENSTLLGVNTATPMGATDANHAAHASPGNGGSTTQHDALGRPYYPALYITNTTLHPLSSGQGVGDWQQGGLPRNINGSGPFVDDVFGTWVVGTQTVNPSAAPGLVGTLNNGPLSTSVNTTTLALQSPLTKTVSSGDTITIATSGHSTTFVASATANPGASSISVTAKKANFAYPNGSTLTDGTAQTGNYARQATLPTKNDWNLGSGSDAPVGTTFASMGDEGYGTEFRWNVNELKDSDGNALTAGNVYKIQIIEHDGDQNKGGDSGEYCSVVSFPGVSTTATGGQIQPDGTATVSDSATVSGVSTPLPSGTNKVTFKVYGPDPTPGSNPADDCTGTPQSKDVALNSSTPSQAYPSGNFTVNAPGDYHFTADLTVGGTVTASSLCDATGETATITSRPTSLTTDAGGPYAPPTSLGDTATLSGGTSNAAGTLTFTLYADAAGACGTQLGQTTVSVNNGADGKQYTGTINAPANPGYFVPGTYHWAVSYSGDPATGNDPSSDGVPPNCPATDSSGPPVNHENPVVLSPSITIDKSPKNQTIESGGTATWTITVNNNGTAPLTHVVINDSNATSLAPDCNRTASQTATLIQGVGNNDSTFDPGESFNYQCTLSSLTGTSFHNVIDVTATSGSKTDVTAEDTADVKILNPSIDVLKSPPSQSVPVGGTANFTITVTNNGDTGLTNVVVQDPAVAGAGTNNCALTAADTLPLITAQGNHDGTFDVGESFQYNCTSGPVTTAFLNVAQACGDDSLGTTVCDTSDNGGSPPPGCPEASRCSTVTIESLSTTQDFKPQDAAHLSGFSNTPNGNATFSLYKDPAGMKTCAPGDLIYGPVPVAINATGDASTASSMLLSALNQAAFGSPATAGNYNWQVSYGGDSNGNADVTGACGTENFQVDNG